MDTIALGRTGIPVSRLGLGGLFVMADLGNAEAGCAALRRALELGVNYFDTAPGYKDSEQVLGKALAQTSQTVVVSTKLGGRPQPFDPKDKAGLRSSVETSLRYLGRDCIDMLLIHEPDRPGQYDWWDDFLHVEGPVLELLDELKAEGKIKYTGLGGTTAHELAHLCASGKFDVVLTAFNYSLLWREAAESVIPAAKAANMGIIVGSLQQGALAGKYDGAVADTTYWLSKARRHQFRKLYDFVDECGISLPELGVRFAFSNPDVHTVLMGAKSTAEVEANVAAAQKGALPGDILQRLDDIAALVPYRPYCEPDGLGWRLPNPQWYKGPNGL